MAAAALVTVLAESARASIVAIGGPEVGNSWAQEFTQQGVGSFDQIVGVIQSGGPFDTISETFPVYGYLTPGLSAPGWSSSVSVDFSTSTISSGSSVTSLNFYATFNSDVTAPVSLIYYTYSEGVLVDESIDSWTGGTFGEWDSTTVPVPESTTLIAGALLILPFGVSALRIMRRPNQAAQQS
jgi:hypothetical protein